MPPLIAVDIGNTRVKLGLFDAPASDTNLPVPRTTLTLPAPEWDDSQLRRWLEPVPAEATWWLASVNRPAAKRMMEWLAPIAHRTIAARHGRPASARIVAFRRTHRRRRRASRPGGHRSLGRRRGGQSPARSLARLHHHRRRQRHHRRPGLRRRNLPRRRHPAGHWPLGPCAEPVH